MNKRVVKRAIDSRLSGLVMPADYRTEVFRRLRGEKRTMKRKISMVPVMVIVFVLLLAGIALAVSGNLFSLFARDNPPLQYIAEHAQTVAPTNMPQTAEPPAEMSPVRIDSSYFDGNTLYLSYRVTGGREFLESFTPSTDQLQHMQSEDNMLAPMLNEPHPVMNRFIEAYNAGSPSGYHHRGIGRSDHIRTADGVDLPWKSEESSVEGDDLLYYIAFASPLPAEVTARDVMTLQLRFFVSDLYLWFDGKRLYSQNEAGKEYCITVDIARNGTIQPRTLSGSGIRGKNAIALTAEVSPLYIRLTYPAVGDIEFGLFDPTTGFEARASSVEPQPDGMVIQVFDGLGTMPDELCAYPVIWQQESGGVTAETHKDQVIRLK